MPVFQFASVPECQRVRVHEFQSASVRVHEWIKTYLCLRSCLSALSSWALATVVLVELSILALQKILATTVLKVAFLGYVS